VDLVNQRHQFDVPASTGRHWRLASIEPAPGDRNNRTSHLPEGVLIALTNPKTASDARVSWVATRLVALREIPLNLQLRISRRSSNNSSVWPSSIHHHRGRRHDRLASPSG